jgi:diacylglycerol kinase (ATP)
MRVAAIFGPGSSQKDLTPFRSRRDIEWSSEISADVNAVLILGGDGTIHRHLAPVSQLQLPLLVVPHGSGNDFARALGIRTFRQATAAWRAFCDEAGNVRNIDLGIIKNAGQAPAPQEAAPGEILFCCVAGVGLDAEAAELANRLPRWLRSHGGYLLSLLRVLPGFSPLPMKISSNESGAWKIHSSDSLMLAAFANTPAYGGGVVIAPRAQVDDGQLDVCLIGGMSNMKAFCLVPTVYLGKHLRISKVDYFQTARARIEIEPGIKVYADGEFVCTTPVEISIRPRALQVIVPCSQP